MSSAAKPPSDSADKFIVRLPEGMRDRIADAARANSRTMNAEVVARLQASFDERTPGGEAHVLLDGVVHMLARYCVTIYEALPVSARTKDLDPAIKFARWLIRGTPGSNSTILAHAEKTGEPVWAALLDFKRRMGDEVKIPSTPEPESVIPDTGTGTAFSEATDYVRRAEKGGLDVPGVWRTKRTQTGEKAEAVKLPAKKRSR